jgi:hypothetical protein
LQRRIRSPRTGTQPTTTFGFSYWMWPQATQTARGSVSPSGTRRAAGAPQELQNLIKGLRGSEKHAGRAPDRFPMLT